MQRYAQNVSGHEEDCGQNQEGEYQVGNDFCDDDQQRTCGRYEQHLHRASLFFPDNGDGGHHGTDQHEQHPHDGRHEVIGGFHLRIVKHP